MREEKTGFDLAACHFLYWSVHERNKERDHKLAPAQENSGKESKETNFPS